MKNSLPWKKLEQQLKDESYRNEIIRIASLDADVKENNLFSNELNKGAFSSGIHHPNQNKSDHMNLFQANKETTANQSQTVSLESSHIFHSMRDVILDYIPPLKTRKPTNKTSKINPETVLFMNLLMDRATHIKNYPQPCEPRLAKFIAANRDAYVPREHVDEPTAIWPGSQVEYVDAGHIGASVSNLGLFRRVIKEKMDEVEKYN